MNGMKKWKDKQLKFKREKMKCCLYKYQEI